jgi:hypothetical protein
MSMALGNAKLYSNLDATIKALEVESQARKRAMEVLAESAKKYRSLVER